MKTIFAIRGNTRLDWKRNVDFKKQTDTSDIVIWCKESGEDLKNGQREYHELLQEEYP